jgi:hypothetical protein
MSSRSEGTAKASRCVMNIAASTVPAAWHAAVSFGLVRVEFLISTIFHRSCAQDFKAFDEAKQNKLSQAYSPTGRGVRQIDWFGETAFMEKCAAPATTGWGDLCPQSTQTLSGSGPGPLAARCHYQLPLCEGRPTSSPNCWKGRLYDSSFSRVLRCLAPGGRLWVCRSSTAR